MKLTLEWYKWRYRCLSKKYKNAIAKGKADKVLPKLIPKLEKLKRKMGT